MVIKNDTQFNETGTMASDFRSSSFINNEEHTLAFISRFNDRRWTREFKVARLKEGRRKSTRTSRLTKSSVYGLSIVFDADQGREYVEEQVSTTTASSAENDQPVADVTREAPHLLNWSEVSIAHNGGSKAVETHRETNQFSFSTTEHPGRSQ